MKIPQKYQSRGHRGLALLRVALQDPAFADKFQKAREKALQQGLDGYEMYEDCSGGSVVKWIKDKASQVKDKVTSYFAPAKDFSNKSRQTLERLGTQQIVELVLRRAPVKDLLNKAMQVLSGGTWDDVRKKYGFDKLFHLSLIATLANRQRVVIEKVEVVTISSGFGTEPDSEYEDVSLQGKTLTLQGFIDTGLKSMGPDKFFLYDAFSNNCQAFIRDLLKANGLLTPEADAFIFQDVSEIAKELPAFTKAVARGVTDVAASVSKLTGQGIDGEIEATLDYLFGSPGRYTGAGTAPGSPYYIAANITVPELAMYINDLTDPTDVGQFINKLQDSKGVSLNAAGFDRKSYYEQQIALAQKYQDVIRAEYKQARDVLNAVRKGNSAALDKARETAAELREGFDTLRKASNPMELLQLGAETMSAMLNFLASGTAALPTGPTSYSYKQQLKNELGEMAGDVGKVAGTAVGAIGEAFGAKTTAQLNDGYVASVLKDKERVSLSLLQDFIDSRKDQIAMDSQRHEAWKAEREKKLKASELRRAYERSVHFMDRDTLPFEMWVARRGAKKR